TRHVSQPVSFILPPPPPPPLAPLSLHDALPIYLSRPGAVRAPDLVHRIPSRARPRTPPAPRGDPGTSRSAPGRIRRLDRARLRRSEEHTSELQSRFDLVCRLLLEKKNKNTCTAS